jgi:hypothetical protein
MREGFFMKWFLSALCAIVAFSGATAAAQPYRLTDLTDEFVAAYDRTEGMPLEVRIKAFKTDVAPLFPDFYGRARFSTITKAQHDARIGRAIERFPAERDAYLSRSASFVALLDPAYASFTRAFSDMGEFGDVYLLHSLGEMDGGTRSFSNGVVLIFGADVMGRVHPNDDVEAFFHHELFHIYHQRTFQECAEVWCSLWSEGLAVHVSRELNPDATDAQLLLTTPEDIPATVNANLAEAVCTVRARLDSSASADLAALFSFSRLNERLPPRFGYYVGYLVAREAGRRHSIQDLARLDAAAARPVVEAALARLARCEG